MILEVFSKLNDCMIYHDSITDCAEFSLWFGNRSKISNS